MISAVGSVGVFIVESSIMILNDAVTVSSKLCRLEFNQLSDYLEQNHGSISESLYRLEKIFMKIVYFDEYVDF